MIFINSNIIFDVGNALIRHNYSITAAESLTGGMFQSTICDVPGISKIFFGGFITYSNHAKHQLLGIPNQIIQDQGVVSKAVAIQMASKSKKIMHTDIGVSFTGVAGPDSLDNQPAGTVWIGLDFRTVPVVARKFNFKGNRDEVRKMSALKAFEMIRNYLLIK